MKHKLIALTIVAALAMSLAGFTIVAAAGQEAILTIVNYVGEELFFTLDGVDSYTVPGIQSSPDGGRLTLNLTPGQHDFSMALGSGPGENGTIDAQAGQAWVLNFATEERPDVGDPNGRTMVIWNLNLVDTTPAAGSSSSATQTSDSVPAITSEPTLTIVNYVGEELYFTLDGVDTYTVPGIESAQDGGKLTLNLTSGTHDFSMALGSGPGENGTIDAQAGQAWVIDFATEEHPDVGNPDYRTRVIWHLNLVDASQAGETMQ